MIKINGKDIKTWGVVFQVGTLEKLLQRGAQKNFTENDFRSIDGKRVIPRHPKQHARSFAVDLSIKGDDELDFISKHDAFFDELASGVVELYVSDLEMTFKLIYIRNQIYISEYSPSFATFRVTFDEINPAERNWKWY